MQSAIPKACLELVLAPRRVKVARPPGYMALTSYSAGLHHVMSEDRCSASFQQPSAPLRAPGFGSSPSERGLPCPHLGPIERVKVEPRPGFEPLPLGTQDASTVFDRWSGSFFQGVSFWSVSIQGPPFTSYRCHPERVFTGPWLLGRPHHPQKSGSQTLGLQCAPPTPPHTYTHSTIWNR